MSAALERAPQTSAIGFPIAMIRECPTNVRLSHDEAKHQELTKSIARLGVLAPVLLRPAPRSATLNYLPTDPTHELVHGHRRYRAAIAAGLTEIPATIRELTDLEVLEIQLAENRERSDLHELDEAEGYRRLLAMKEYKKEGVAKIAERVGLSTKYVYDRVRLCDLTDKAKTAFREGKFAAGHAILLARLDAKTQERAMRPGALYDVECGASFHQAEEEGTLDAAEPTKPRSVREFGRWIDEHVRFDATKADPILETQTIERLAGARQSDQRVVPITYGHMLSPELKGAERTVCVNSWERADGEAGSKTCEHAVLGLVVVGYRRGQAFDICIARDKCEVHWRERIAAQKRNAKARDKAVASGKPAAPPAKSKWQIEDEKARAAEERYRKAAPEILRAVASAIKSAPLKAIKDLLLENIEGTYDVDFKAAEAAVPPGKTAEGFLRHLAVVVAWARVEADGSYGARDVCAFLGLDLAKLVDEHAPTVEKSTPAKSGSAQKAKNVKKRAAKK